MYKNMRERRSVRAFTDEAVSPELIANLLISARTAPSGANLQPGKFYVLASSALDALKATLKKAVDDDVPLVEAYSYFPTPMKPYLKRRQIAAGAALYDALRIDRRDKEGRKAQFARNYRFFDAPVGIIVTIDRDMGKGCFMDLGMALQNLQLAAVSKGLGCCGIGALASYGPTIHQHLKLSEEELVVCGFALGYEDPDEPINQIRTERLALDEFSEFRGFDEQS